MEWLDLDYRYGLDGCVWVLGGLWVWFGWLGLGFERIIGMVWMVGFGFGRVM